MKYLINTKSITLFEKGLEKIINHEKISDDSIFTFDFLEKNALHNLIKEYSLESLFGDKKLVIIKNFDYSELDKKQLLIFEDLLNLKLNNVLTIHNVSKKKLADEQIKHFQVFNLEIPENLESFLIGWLKNKNITLTKEEVKSILSRTKNDFELLTHEIQKIKHLEQSDVSGKVAQIVYDYKESTPFTFIEAFLTKNQKILEKEVDRLIKEGYNEVFLISRLISETILVILLKTYSDKETFKIENKISDYRYKKLDYHSHNWLSTDLIDIVEKLLNLKEQLYKEKNLAFNSQIFFYKLVEILII